MLLEASGQQVGMSDI